MYARQRWALLGTRRIQPCAKDNTIDNNCFLFENVKKMGKNLQYVSVVSVSIVSCLSLELFLPMAKSYA